MGEGDRFIGEEAHPVPISEGELGRQRGEYEGAVGCGLALGGRPGGFEGGNPVVVDLGGEAARHPAAIGDHGAHK
jgi:hypothetical protein